MGIPPSLFGCWEESGVGVATLDDATAAELEPSSFGFDVSWPFADFLAATAFGGCFASDRTGPTAVSFLAHCSVILWVEASVSMARCADSPPHTAVFAR